MPDYVTPADETPAFEIPADENHGGVRSDRESLPHALEVSALNEF